MMEGRGALIGRWTRTHWSDLLGGLLLLGCGANSGPQSGDAGMISSDAAEPAAANADAASYWDCEGDDYGCACDDRGNVMPGQDTAAACGAAACCVEASREDGGRTCRCLSVEGTLAARTTCNAWTDEQLSACTDGHHCQVSDGCPPGAHAPPASDAGGSDAWEFDSGTPTEAVTDGAAADAPGTVSNDAADQGRVQHCVFAEGCFEFRDHSPSCFEGNELNCRGGFRGTYAVGDCPAAEYSRVIEGPTGCGTTVSYLY
jgi:hypothetical protein